MISHLSLIRTIFRLLFNFQGSSAVFFRDSLYIISQANRLVKRFLKVFQNSFEFSVSPDRVSRVFACDSYILPHLPLFVNTFFEKISFFRFISDKRAVFRVPRVCRFTFTDANDALYSASDTLLPGYPACAEDQKICRRK